MSPRTLAATAAPAFGPAERKQFLASFWAMDKKLQQAGFHPLSPWWRAQITRFVRSGCKRWVIRAGRRAGKSSALARLAVAVAWFGSWHVPAGDDAVIPFVSVSKDEASARLRTIDAILSALGFKHEVRGEEIELLEPRTVVFRAIACTTKASVGFTAIFIACDEVARWESRDTGANPAAEVVGSLAPAMATQPNAWLVLGSSPWGTDDYHAQAFDRGDSDAQSVSHAPTWEANPTITEAETHELEPDPRIWQREYAAIPGATLTAAIDHEDVVACFGRVMPLPRTLGNPFVAIDASSLRGDAFTWIAGGITAAGELCVREAGGWEGEQLRHVSMADVVREIATVARDRGVVEVFGDQREEAALGALFNQHGVSLRTFAWSEPSKDEAMMLLRRLMRERHVLLLDHARLRSELVNMKARLVPSGRIYYATNGLDYASALITVAHALVAGELLTDTGGYARAVENINAFTQHAALMERFGFRTFN